jgi:hypothetical protein
MGPIASSETSVNTIRCVTSQKSEEFNYTAGGKVETSQLLECFL